MNYRIFLMFLVFACFCESIYGDSAHDKGRDSTSDAKNFKNLPVNVTLSNADYCIKASFTALILQPVTTNMHYAAETSPFVSPTPSWAIHDINTDYQFGFDIGIEGIIHSRNNCITLNWQRFYSSDSSSTAVPADDMLGPFFTIGPNAAPYINAIGKMDFHFNEVHLDYGVLVGFGDHIKTNLFTGVSYAYIKQILEFNYFNTSQSITRYIVTPSKFSGAGPQAGVSFTYQIVKGFHLAGDTVVSLLVGSISNNTTYKSTSPDMPIGVASPNTQTTKTSTRTQLIPAFNGSLGFNYIQNVSNRFFVCLEAGYKAEVYLGALQLIDMGSEVPLGFAEPAPVGVYAKTFQRNLSNFALAGPYVKLEIKF